jgi:glutathione S-transferase
MTAKAVGVEFNLHVINTMKGEQLTPEYLKMNPQHTVPTLKDGDFVLWESRAIMAYLVGKFGKSDALYPKDVKLRAVVDQRMYFDMGTLNEKFHDYFKMKVFKKDVDATEQLKALEAALEFLNKFLEGASYVAGDHLTIADITIFATVSTCELAGVSLEKFSNVTKWVQKCRDNIPGVQLNNEGIEILRKYICSKA